MWFWPFAASPSHESGMSFEENGFLNQGLSWPPPDPDKMPAQRNLDSKEKSMQAEDMMGDDAGARRQDRHDQGGGVTRSGCEARQGPTLRFRRSRGAKCHCRQEMVYAGIVGRMSAQTFGRPLGLIDSPIREISQGLGEQSLQAVSVWHCIWRPSNSVSRDTEPYTSASIILNLRIENLRSVVGYYT